MLSLRSFRIVTLPCLWLVFGLLAASKSEASSGFPPLLPFDSFSCLSGSLDSIDQQVGRHGLRVVARGRGENQDERYFFLSQRNSEAAAIMHLARDENSWKLCFGLAGREVDLPIAAVYPELSKQFILKERFHHELIERKLGDNLPLASKTVPLETAKPLMTFLSVRSTWTNRYDPTINLDLGEGMRPYKLGYLASYANEKMARMERGEAPMNESEYKVHMSIFERVDPGYMPAFLIADRSDGDWTVLISRQSIQGFQAWRSGSDLEVFTENGEWQKFATGQAQ